MMNESYLSGFIDADGCIVIGQGTINIRVAQKDTKILHMIQETFGGEFVLASGKSGVYNLRWYGDKAIELGKRIHPYIIQKRAELDIMFEYAKTRGIRGKHTTSEVKEERKRLEELMKYIRNHRLKGKMVNGVFVKEGDL